MAAINGNGAIVGTEAADQITGGDGSDSIIGGAGADALNGGPGVDFAEYSTSPAGIDASIAAGGAANDGAGGSDTFVGIEGIVGSLNNDRIVGGALPDVLIGLEGDDTIDGGAGNDLLRGNGGADQIAGGDGIDTAFYGGGLRGYAIAANGANLAVSGNGAAGGPDGADALAGVEVLAFADGRMVFDPDDPAARVTRLYEAALDRLPDQAGLNFWTGALQAGQPLSALASGFLESPEFAARFGALPDNGAFIDRLYLNVLGREADPAGKQGWLDLMNNGAGRAQVLEGFSESAENKANTAGLVANGIWDRSETAAAVARLYDTVLGRAPDAAGLSTWSALIDGGALSLRQVADGFTGSAEFQARYGSLDDRDFVAELYRNSLDREPDAAGLEGWVGMLQRDMARSEVVLNFSESAEHVLLTAPDIQSDVPSEYGILFA